MKIFIHFIIINTILLGGSFLKIIEPTKTVHQHYYNRNSNVESHKNYREDVAAVTFAEVDAAADQYVSAKYLYEFRESKKIINHLYKQLEINKNSIAINWALMRFYAIAPTFSGGSTAMALQFAGYIYSLNEYLGCLAFEYVYTKRKQMDNAEEWYKKSLIIALPKNMYWQEISYSKFPQLSIKITGNFNNWKTQNMYAGSGLIYKRRIMVPKCESCVYKVIVDYTNINNPLVKELKNPNYW